MFQNKVEPLMSELILTTIHPQTRTKWFYQPPSRNLKFQSSKIQEAILPDLKKVGSYLRVFTVSYFTKQPLL